MNIAVIGAAGGVGRLVVQQLVEQGHGVRALVRRPEQGADLSQLGAVSVPGDLTGEWRAVLDGTDAVVWAAGAGTSGDFRRIDNEALVQLVRQLEADGPVRLVVVSSMGVDRPEQMPPFLLEVLRAKAVSDAAVQASRLAFTIVRPGGLNNEPASGRVTVAAQAPRGMISRTDVAAVVVACLHQPGTVGHTFEVVAGETPVAQAVDQLTTQS
ncbi:SDR family oxidoreductase [Deinococcus sonorensis]|uniref:SDR family oxidoreductase n=2 Tax=Deinococcus sonorensis TaxID=309891 RepID=A0ABV8Y5R2_9DEIO